jgi:glycosyltransferase involved in cell wall biosynthesis
LLVQIKLWQRWSDVFRLSVTNSEEGRRLLAADRFDPVEMVWNGVAPVPPRPPLLEVPILLFAGRLVYQKGVDILLRAFARAVKEVPTARLLIAGDGPERAALTTLTRDLALDGSVSLLGHLSRPVLEREAAAS